MCQLILQAILYITDQDDKVKDNMTECQEGGRRHNDTVGNEGDATVGRGGRGGAGSVSSLALRLTLCDLPGRCALPLVFALEFLLEFSRASRQVSSAASSTMWQVQAPSKSLPRGATMWRRYTSLLCKPMQAIQVMPQ
jgi:hypothetical protein